MTGRPQRNRKEISGRKYVCQAAHRFGEASTQPELIASLTNWLWMQAQIGFNDGANECLDLFTTTNDASDIHDTA